MFYGTPQFCYLSPLCPWHLITQGSTPTYPHLDISHTPVFPTVGHHNAYIHHDSPGSLFFITRFFRNFADHSSVKPQNCLQNFRRICQLEVLSFDLWNCTTFADSFRFFITSHMFVFLATWPGESMAQHLLSIILWWPEAILAQTKAKHGNFVAFYEMS